MATDLDTRSPSDSSVSTPLVDTEQRIWYDRSSQPWQLPQALPEPAITVPQPAAAPIAHTPAGVGAVVATLAEAAPPQQGGMAGPPVPEPIDNSPPLEEDDCLRQSNTDQEVDQPVPKQQQKQQRPSLGSASRPQPDAGSQLGMQVVAFAVQQAAQEASGAGDRPAQSLASQGGASGSGGSRQPAVSPTPQGERQGSGSQPACCPACGMPRLTAEQIASFTSERKPGAPKHGWDQDLRKLPGNQLTEEFCRRHFVEATMRQRDVFAYHGQTASSCNRALKKYGLSEAAKHAHNDAAEEGEEQEQQQQQQQEQQDEEGKQRKGKRRRT